MELKTKLSLTLAKSLRECFLKAIILNDASRICNAWDLKSMSLGTDCMLMQYIKECPIQISKLK